MKDFFKKITHLFCVRTKKQQIFSINNLTSSCCFQFKYFIIILCYKMKVLRQSHVSKAIPLLQVYDQNSFSGNSWNKMNKNTERNRENFLMLI